MSDYLGLSYFLFAVSPNPMKISVVSDPLDGTSADAMTRKPDQLNLSECSRSQ
jgi:hypothetical protein